VSFWRKEVIQPALDSETRKHMEEQLAWIAREPANARPYLHLGEFYRMEGRQELAELYAVRADYPAAWRHARLAERGGEPRAVALLERHGVPE
jgi:hypothetical protein